LLESERDVWRDKARAASSSAIEARVAGQQDAHQAAQASNGEVPSSRPPSPSSDCL
jgi:hypothetical protein